VAAPVPSRETFRELWVASTLVNLGKGEISNLHDTAIRRGNISLEYASSRGEAEECLRIVFQTGANIFCHKLYHVVRKIDDRFDSSIRQDNETFTALDRKARLRLRTATESSMLRKQLIILKIEEAARKTEIDSRQLTGTRRESRNEIIQRDISR